jgi:hypothetical protein
MRPARRTLLGHRRCVAGRGVCAAERRWRRQRPSATVRGSAWWGAARRAAQYMTRSGADYAAGQSERGGFGFADDAIMMPTHGVNNVDALAHVWCDGQLYNLRSRPPTPKMAN